VIGWARFVFSTLIFLWFNSNGCLIGIARRARRYRNLRDSMCSIEFIAIRKSRHRYWRTRSFGVYIEQEPYVRELIEAYMGSNFKSVLELLSRYSVRILLLISIGTILRHN